MHLVVYGPLSNTPFYLSFWTNLLYLGGSNILFCTVKTEPKSYRGPEFPWSDLLHYLTVYSIKIISEKNSLQLAGNFELR